ncbi:MAG: GntR family transcriptional regulator [Litorimonas sp.]
MKTTSTRSSLGSIRSLKKVPLSETIADTIAQAIADNQIKPGERIVEVALAQKLNVSRVPVREALKILATQGVLQDGRQSYEVPQYSAEGAGQIQEARIMLETLLLRDAIKFWHESGAIADALTQELDHMRAAAKSGQIEEFRRHDLAFHREVSVAANNEIVRTLWETTARHVLIVLNVPSASNIDLELLVQKHADLMSFIDRQVQNPGPIEDIQNALSEHFV